VFNRISPEMARRLNILSLSHWTFRASPSIQCQEIPLSTLVDSICSEKKIAGPSFEMKRLLNAWNLIGVRSGTYDPNSWVIVGPYSVQEYLATLSWSAESLLRLRQSGKLRRSKSTPNSSSTDGSSNSAETSTS
jgi:hypothetical protein